MEVTSGGKETPLSTLRPCRMEVPPSRALYMNGSLYLIFDYVLRKKNKDLES